MMIARLVLRNRPNRTQKPRIVVFVGSPIVQVAKGQSSEEVGRGKIDDGFDNGLFQLIPLDFERG